MQMNTVATLAKIGTKRAKRDAQGIVVEEPAVLIQLEVPISNLDKDDLAGLLRAVDQDVELVVRSPQRGFAVKDGALVPEPVGAR